MASIHPKLKTVHVFFDGDGGQVLKVLDAQGQQHVFDLTPERCMALISQLALAAKDLMAEKPG